MRQAVRRCYIALCLGSLSAFAAPVAVISTDITGGPAPLTVNFYGSSSTADANATYLWEFGDGLTATTVQATHVYEAGGQYIVSLTVANPDETSDTSHIAITVSDITGPAPLAVPFDAGKFTAAIDILQYAWTFGDGLSSNLSRVTHIYKNAGTFIATLVVTHADQSTTTYQVTVVVTGAVQGTVTPNINFRLAVVQAHFKLVPGSLLYPVTGTSSADSFSINAAFSTVDIPGTLKGLAASFSINGQIAVSGALDGVGELFSPERLKKPTYFMQVSPNFQRFTVTITKAGLLQALFGSQNQVPAVETKVPVTITLTIGAETYNETIQFDFVPSGRGGGIGKFGLAQRGAEDGFFMVAQAQAVETATEDSHFFFFQGYLSLPNGNKLLAPAGGTWTITLNEAAPIVIPFDQLRRRGKYIVFTQPDRAAGTINELRIDTLARQFAIQTWDILASANRGGSGLPLSGQAYTGYNFALRMDLDQPDGSTIQVVTTTRLTRKSAGDAVWGTGRKNQKE